MENKDKIKLKELFEEINNIPKEKDMEKEMKNLFPLLFKVRDIKLKYQDIEGEDNKIFKEEFSDMLPIYVADRMARCILEKNQIKWKDYINKMKKEETKK